MSVAWVGAGIAAVGVVSGAMSSNKAANAQIDSTREANAAARAGQMDAQAFQQKQIDQSRADSEPWRQAGIGALNKLSGMGDFTGDSVKTDPGYQFGLNEGMKGVTNSAAARGGLLSGAALKAASRYNSDYATTKFDDAFNRDVTTKNRLASLAGVGQVATSQNNSNAAAMGANVGNGMLQTGLGIGNNMIGAGNARASSYLATGNALTQGLNQGISAWNQYNNNGYHANGVGSGSNPYAGYDAAGNGGWGIE